jgi:hypothetical protein
MAVVLQEQLIKEAMVATVHLMQTKALEAAVAVQRLAVKEITAQAVQVVLVEHQQLLLLV